MSFTNSCNYIVLIVMGWICQSKILSSIITNSVLRQEKIEYVLTGPYPDDLPTGLTIANRRAHEKHCDNVLNVNCLMLATMSPDLQKQYEHVDAYIGATWDI
jgi:hypothetical protein